MTYHHLGRSEEAWKMYEKLTQFEPKYAATLKRDLEQTNPQAVSNRKDSAIDGGHDRRSHVVPEN